MNRAFLPLRKVRDRSALLRAVQEPRFQSPRPERQPPSLVNSWWFLIPFGLICVGMLLARAWGIVQ
ncbi:MAG: hypothetical protein ACTHMO_03905 [Rhodanobacteraceae bacterium]